jgi:hypothetical protein
VFPLFVTEETFLFFVSISQELSNWESYFHLHEIFNTNRTVSQFCKEFRDFELTEPFSDRAIEFLSSHFYEIDFSFLKARSVNTVEESRVAEIENFSNLSSVTVLDLNGRIGRSLRTFVVINAQKKSGYDRLWNRRSFFIRRLTAKGLQFFFDRLSRFTISHRAGI